MSKIYYEKVGNKYVPVREYDHSLMDSMTAGNHLLMIYPGGKSLKYNVDPATAPLIAAGRASMNEMCDKIYKASASRPARQPVTPEQAKAWADLSAAFGESNFHLTYNSSRDIAEAGIKVLEDQAKELLEIPSVKHAYEEFLLICKLAMNKK